MGHTVYSFPYNEYTVILKEYIGPLDFDRTGVELKKYGKVWTTKYTTIFVQRRP